MAKTSEIIARFKKAKTPFTPLYWHVLVQIPKPAEAHGSILKPEDLLDHEEFSSFIGCVAAVGQFAFQAKTKAEIDLGEMTRKPKVGDWVIFGKHAGEKFRTKDKTLWILMADTELRGITENPDDFECLEL